MSLVQPARCRGAECSFLRQGRLGPVVTGRRAKLERGWGLPTKPVVRSGRPPIATRWRWVVLRAGAATVWTSHPPDWRSRGAAGGPAPAFVCFISSHQRFDELCSCSIMSTFVSANGAEQPFSLQAVAYSNREQFDGGSPGRGFGRCRDSVKGVRIRAGANLKVIRPTLGARVRAAGPAARRLARQFTTGDRLERSFGQVGHALGDAGVHRPRAR